MNPYTARSPVDLLAAVPYVLGFHPEDSIVLLTFGPGESFHARLDLPVVEHEQRAVVALLHEVIRRNGSSRIALLLYTEDRCAAASFDEIAVEVLIDAGIEIVDILRVTGETFHPADDIEDAGTPYDLTSHPFTAEQVLRGRVVHDSRASLADSLIGTNDEDTERIAEAADRAADSLLAVGHRIVKLSAPGTEPTLPGSLVSELEVQARWLQRTIRHALPDPGVMSSTDAGRVLVLVALEALREVAWAEMTRPDASRHIELWRSLVRRAPADLRCGPAALLAFAAWLAGEGALAWCALDRCFEVDPDDSLGQQVAALLESATPPSVWAPIPQRALRVFGSAAS